MLAFVPAGGTTTKSTKGEQQKTCGSQLTFLASARAQLKNVAQNCIAGGQFTDTLAT